MLIESKIEKFLNEEEMPFKNNKETRKYLTDLVKNDDFAKPFSFDIINLENGEVYFVKGESILAKAKAHQEALIRDAEKIHKNDREILADADDEDDKVFWRKEIARAEKIMNSLRERMKQGKQISREYVEDLF